MATKEQYTREWVRVAENLGARTNALSKQSGGIQIVPKVIGDEVLVKRLMTGDARAAYLFKRMHRRVAARTIVPAVRKQIPRSRAAKRHLRSGFRVRRVRLEGAWVATGDRQLFYAAALNAKVPWLLRGLMNAEEKYIAEYQHALGEFTKWLATGVTPRII